MFVDRSVPRITREYERFTFVRVLILIVNLFVIWYLATRVKDEKKEEKLATNVHEITQNID